MSKGWVVLSLVALAGAALGCADDGQPAAALPELDFQLTVQSTTVPDKGVIPVTARLTRARFVVFPLRFRFEKQNVGEEPFLVGERLVFEPEGAEITEQIDVRADPTIRVTVTESAARGMSVTRTVQIDVLTFP